MISQQEVNGQLSAIGASGLTFCGAEIRQLPRILQQGEVIEHIMGGRYIAGYAIMVATNRRLLVIDKIIGGITIEDIPFDMIAEVEFMHTPFNTKLIVFARSKKIEFKAMRHSHAREFAEYLESRMMEIRNINSNQQKVVFNQEYYAAPSTQPE